jgi:hypothetical protein
VANIRDIRKVRKTQQQNHEFGKKKPAKKYTSIQCGMKLRKPSILVVN